MPPDHVGQHGVENGDLEREVEPRLVDQQADEEDDYPRVEREHVGVFHQRQAFLAEFAPEPLGRLAAVFLADDRHHPLEAGGHRFLFDRIINVEVFEELVDKILPPAHLLVALAQGGGVGQLAAVFALQEEEVDVPVVVGHGRLAAVEEAGEEGEGPDPEAPLGRQAQADGGVDGDKPNVARQPVEDTPQRAFLPRHPRQLAVGAVERVGPDQQEHADHVDQEVARIEAHSGQDADEDAGDRHAIRRDAEAAEQERPAVADRPVEMDVDELFRVDRLEGRFDAWMLACFAHG